MTVTGPLELPPDPSPGGLVVAPADEVPATARRPWNVAAATGLGPLPGTSPDEAARSVAGELPDLPHLAELPGRGAGADAVGRTVSLLVDIWADVVPSGWRVSRRPGRDTRRAVDFLSWDLDAAEQHYAGADWVKVQVVGPWSLAAAIETPSGNRALTDAGAVRDLAASLGEGLAAHLADVRRRLPAAGVVLQLDEPDLPAVLAGSLPTASGFGTVRAIDEQVVRDVLAELVATVGSIDTAGTVAALGTAGTVGTPVLAVCPDPRAPLGLLREIGASALWVDATAVGTAAARLDPIGEAVEAGVAIVAGLVPAAGPTTPRSLGAAARPLTEAWRRLGLPRTSLADVVVTPTGSLAQVSADRAVTAMATCRRLAQALQDPPDGW
ncbi:methionine synthase [Nakamurella endophytica]|uniref:Methionine synthase n=1 Tax=Nakamurella endophytica TaxID=1748367 RepID=A0A917SKW9_9ACTN|nr:methionine synthase [Nakamurella endophytica]GGL85583.1 methionine synthase [Nakamurella endophytica]